MIMFWVSRNIISFADNVIETFVSHYSNNNYSFVPIAKETYQVINYKCFSLMGLETVTRWIHHA